MTSPDAAVDLLESLVRIPSVSGDEAAASAHLVTWMAQHGASRAFVDGAGNAVGVWGHGPRQLVLLGHIDTVGGFPTVRRDGDLLYGRGTVDAKGPLCAFAAAASMAAVPDGWQVVVIGAVEEECPTSAGAHFAIGQYAPDLCVIGEPSRWDRLTLGYKGRLIADVTLTCPHSHSAGQSATAAEAAFAVWRDVSDYANRINDGRARVFDQLDAALMRINTADDGLTQTASLSLGFRLPPPADPHTLERDLRDLIAASTPDAAAVDLRFSSHTPAFTAERDHTLSRLLRAAIRAEGGTPAFVMKTGTSDMNLAGPAWNCPILAYGPGDSALDHTPNEHIDLNEYRRAIRILTHTLNALSRELSVQPASETPYAL